MDPPVLLLVFTREPVGKQPFLRLPKALPERDEKDGTPTFPGFAPDPTAVRLHYLLGDMQTEAHTGFGVVERVDHLVEALEDPLPVSFGMPGPLSITARATPPARSETV